jgi:hypothetical protein
LNVSELDCQMRSLAFEYAKYIQPFRLFHRPTDDIVFQQVQDALQLSILCPKYVDTNNVDEPTQGQKQHATTAFTKRSEKLSLRVVDGTTTTTTTTTTPHTDMDILSQRSVRGVVASDDRQRRRNSADVQEHTIQPCTSILCIYVDHSLTDIVRRSHSSFSRTATTGSNKTNTATTAIFYQVPNIADALTISRQHHIPYQTTILFRTGIHYVGAGSIGTGTGSSRSSQNQNNSNSTRNANARKQQNKPVELTYEDSGLTIIGEPNAWLSGAIPIPIPPHGSNNKHDHQHSNYNGEHSLQKDRVQTRSTTSATHTLQDNIRIVNLTEFFQVQHITKIPKLISLFDVDQRYIRARYPNANPEVDQWGYNSPNRLSYSIPPEEVLEWHKPKPYNGSIPTFTYLDLRRNEDNPHRPIKNDSTMDMYNVYSVGTGGVCGALWGTNEPSYWCSNSSAGGWAEVDQQAATLGQLNLPIGMTFNQTSMIGIRMNHWTTNQSAVNAIIHAWHSQSWAVHMFPIQAVEAGTFHFAEGGGRQGARNWCRCDQCSYAAPWCGQRQQPRNDSDTRLISGTWFIENLLSELDIPGEFFFDIDTNLLYLYPNHTTNDASNIILDDGMDGLRIAVLDQLIRLTNGVKDVSISNLGFRDTAATYLSDWSVPSGGDWSMHRGGAIFMESAENISTRDCLGTQYSFLVERET